MEVHVQGGLEIQNELELRPLPQSYADVYTYQLPQAHDPSSLSNNGRQTINSQRQTNDYTPLATNSNPQLNNAYQPTSSYQPTSHYTLPATNNDRPTTNDYEKAKMWYRLSWRRLALFGVLAAILIGFIAGTGVAAARAHAAEASLRSLKSPATFDAITRNCSTKADTVTGTTYASFPARSVIYTIYCYEDSSRQRLLVIFTPDFDTCMDACSSYNVNAEAINSTNRCGAVTFIPPWSNKDVASAANAAGNCFLKAPQTTDDLRKSAASEYHAGLLNR